MTPYAILGTGWISEEFYAASLFAELALQGVCSRTPEAGLAFAQRIGQPDVPVFTSVEALAAAPGIDAVYIASPNSLHASQCEALLQASKHVLCEKPIVTRPGDLERLQSLARKKGLVLMEAIMYLQTPARKAVRTALPELGEITSAHFDFSQLSSKYDDLAAGRFANVFLPGMQGGAWNDLGVYCIYPALDFFGPPQAMQAQTHLLPNGVDSAGAALLRYPDFPVTLTWNKLGQSRGVTQILGTRGTITIRSISRFEGITLHPRAGEPRALAPSPQGQHRDTMRYEAQAFRDYIAGRPAAVPYEEASALALAVAETMERIRKAW